MEKFVNNDSVIARRRSRRGDFLRACFVALLLAMTPILLAGCASVQAPGYISRIDHPYKRKYYASFEKVTSSFMYVLKKQGWTIDSEADPTLYERDDRYDNNGYQNLLIITNIKKQSLHLTGMHLNVFLHSIGNTCDVEIRLSSGRNDRVAHGILDAVEEGSVILSETKDLNRINSFRDSSVSPQNDK